MHPKISFTIAIPAYKGKFLKEAIQSCFNQTYALFEIIVLDDASPENIMEICYGFSDPRLKYFRNDVNVGAEKVVDAAVLLGGCHGTVNPDDIQGKLAEEEAAEEWLCLDMGEALQHGLHLLAEGEHRVGDADEGVVFGHAACGGWMNGRGGNLRRGHNRVQCSFAPVHGFNAPSARFKGYRYQPLLLLCAG